MARLAVHELPASLVAGRLLTRLPFVHSISLVLGGLASGHSALSQPGMRS
jgi:hypothetical protein